MLDRNSAPASGINPMTDEICLSKLKKTGRFCDCPVNRQGQVIYTCNEGTHAAPGCLMRRLLRMLTVFPPLAGFTVGQSDQAWAPWKGKTNRRGSGEEEFGLVNPKLHSVTFKGRHKVFFFFML